MTDTSGPASGTLFAWYDLDECCWRTSQATFLSGSDRFSETWPRSGTTRAGSAFELPMPALPTTEPESSSLLPTPAVNDMGRAYTPQEWDAWTERMKAAHSNGNGHGKSLEIEAQRLLPTPTVDDAGNLTQDSGDFQSLTRTAMALLPTPRASDGEKGGPNQRGSSGDLMLPSAVVQMFPTPRATRGGSATETAYLLTGKNRSGEPTDPPSDAGSTPSDGELPGQLSLDVPESA